MVHGRRPAAHVGRTRSKTRRATAPSSCHGIVGSDGTRRGMTRGRSATMSFVGFGGFTDFGSSGLPKVRCGFTSRGSG